MPQRGAARPVAPEDGTGVGQMIVLGWNAFDYSTGVKRSFPLCPLLFAFAFSLKLAL